MSLEDNTISFPPSNMKTKIIVASVIAFGIIAAAFVLVLGVRSEPASAERQLPDEAQSWIASIKTGAADWKVQLEIEKTARVKRIELEDTVSGLRKSLCSRYHITVKDDGTVADAAECASFQ